MAEQEMVNQLKNIVQELKSLNRILTNKDVTNKDVISDVMIGSDGDESKKKLIITEYNPNFRQEHLIERLTNNIENNGIKISEK